MFRGCSIQSFQKLGSRACQLRNAQVNRQTRAGSSMEATTGSISYAQQQYLNRIWLTNPKERFLQDIIQGLTSEDIFRITVASVMQSAEFSPQFYEEWVFLADEFACSGCLKKRDAVLVMHKLVLCLLREQIVPALNIIASFPHMLFEPVYSKLLFSLFIEKCFQVGEDSEHLLDDVVTEYVKYYVLTSNSGEYTRVNSSPSQNVDNLTSTELRQVEIVTRLCHILINHPHRQAFSLPVNSVEKLFKILMKPCFSYQDLSLQAFTIYAKTLLSSGRRESLQIVDAIIGQKLLKSGSEEQIRTSLPLLMDTFLDVKSEKIQGFLWLVSIPEFVASALESSYRSTAWSWELMSYQRAYNPTEVRLLYDHIKTYTQNHQDKDKHHTMICSSFFSIFRRSVEFSKFELALCLWLDIRALDFSFTPFHYIFAQGLFKELSRWKPEQLLRTVIEIVPEDLAQTCYALPIMDLFLTTDKPQLADKFLEWVQSDDLWWRTFGACKTKGHIPREYFGPQQTLDDLLLSLKNKMLEERLSSMKDKSAIELFEKTLQEHSADSKNLKDTYNIIITNFAADHPADTYKVFVRGRTEGVQLPASAYESLLKGLVGVSDNEKVRTVLRAMKEDKIAPTDLTKHILSGFTLTSEPQF
eukprot:TRINITY_DN5469_c0_g1_i1.p1 TRINITY_DN5469_c0_g1~~TRINITY_DN5469_c0_g1_i1.p1  ORF type:complete len:642 (-),score=74.35 TRINITY_DN5469_c0_g1_i1:134-2059(-)